MIRFQNDSHLSYQNVKTCCQGIVHPLVFCSGLVLIFSLSLSIGSWQQVLGYARSSVSFCSFRSKKKLMTTLEKRVIFYHPKTNIIYHLKGIVIIISKRCVTLDKDKSVFRRQNSISALFESLAICHIASFSSFASKEILLFQNCYAPENKLFFRKNVHDKTPIYERISSFECAL